jgi:hypothetical protein
MTNITSLVDDFEGGRYIATNTASSDTCKEIQIEVKDEDDRTE